MFDDSRAFITRAFLRGKFDTEYKVYVAEEDASFLTRLKAWNARPALSETQTEAAFIQAFFVETWGYALGGGAAPADQVTAIPQFPIAGEGSGGGQGAADLALGWLRGRTDATPQVLCEFKDIKSNLDAKQNRKGSTRSPVQQCLAYVRGARRGLFGNEPVQPWWGLVTDMNEFRLYWWDRAPDEYLRFVIRDRRDLLSTYDLLTEGGDYAEDARFDRFLFWRLFQRDTLIAQAGKPPLLRLIADQWVKESDLEEEFYDRYRGVRDRLYDVLVSHNQAFPGSRTDLLRLTQKLLDRLIFAFYCEDMGERMLFPPQLIRERLKRESVDDTYDPNGDEIWAWLRRLFAYMNTGGRLGQLPVPHINGGLFETDPLIEGLTIPNHVFAAPGQGVNDTSLERDRTTVLYLCARYNYAARGDARESLSLYTLGRIFEQSITELEYKAGEIEGRDTLASVGKRKRDGVYYTPEWVVNLLVRQALDPWLAAARLAAGWTDPESDAPNLAAAQAFRDRLAIIRVVDPACGSGAFLISIFRRLLDERLAAERAVARLEAKGLARVPPEGEIIASVLADNIYGVDINPASVEIAKLALWLHSARADAPLSRLDHTLRCGNSLIGPEFWRGRADDPDLRERINAFDWRAAFPEVWPEGDAGGFDLVLGNPPYVKLQNVVKVDPEVAAWLQSERGDDTWRSARTGNFDLYLPFIEQGLRLLGSGGRMAYIAPSLWVVNAYGRGLRSLVRERRQLERWTDFRSHQIFDEAITYTSLQVFSKEPTEGVRIALAPGGESDAADVDWTNDDLLVPWDAFSADEEWLIATGAERRLIDRLKRDCLRLDDRSLTDGIIVGLQTSADPIYHLDKVRDGHYTRKEGKGRVAVEIEDGIMKPLISGAEAKRYEDPETSTYILFPYERTPGGAMRLISEADMRRRFPKAWRHLVSFEDNLRRRESGKFDDENWHQFGRNQSINRQEDVKLIVPRIVEHLKVSLDADGNFCLDNVDVGGVISTEVTDPAYLMGNLNGSVVDVVFRVIAKPFQNDYRSANKQFIAPLPIPRAGEDDRAEVARRARELQDAWTRRRDLLRAAAERLGGLARSRHGPNWLFADLERHDAILERAPASLTAAGDRRTWAGDRFKALEAVEIARLQAALNGGARLTAAFTDGELRLFADGAPVLARIYMDDAPGRMAEAYWRYLFHSQSWRDAATLAGKLRLPPVDADTPAARQFVERVQALVLQVAAIETAEDEMNTLLYRLYDLSEEERDLVEKEQARHRAA